MEETIKIISRVQEYIESHLQQNITLLKLSKVANYSTYHTERLFKEVVGIAPFEYIRRLRLTAAAKVLRDNNVKIIDTALDFMFDSHEGFTRAFSKEFGISPFAYKKNPMPLKYFISYNVISQLALSKKEEKKTMDTQVVFTQVIERPARKAIIKRGIKADNYFEYCEEVDCEVWGVLTSIKDALFEPAGFWLPKKLIKSNTSKYVQGVEVPLDYTGKVPEGFEIIELEPCKLMVFNSEPFADENFMEVIQFIWQAIDKFNPKTYGYAWADDVSPRFQLEPWGHRGYIEARPIKNQK